MRIRNAVLLAAYAMTLAGCSNPQTGDASACHRYETAFNGMQRAVKAFHDGTGTAAAAQATQDVLLLELSGAREDAETPALRTLLEDSRDMLTQGFAGNDDAGAAFFFLSSDVEGLCESLGAAIALETNYDE